MTVNMDASVMSRIGVTLLRSQRQNVLILLLSALLLTPTNTNATKSD